MSIFDLAKQLQQMQSEMKKAQDLLATKTVVGSGAGGAVIVELTGTMEVKQVTIDPQLAARQDVPALQKAVSEAVEDGLRQVHKLASSQLSGLTGLAAKLGADGNKK